MNGNKAILDTIEQLYTEKISLRKSNYLMPSFWQLQIIWGQIWLQMIGMIFKVLIIK